MDKNILVSHKEDFSNFLIHRKIRKWKNDAFPLTHFQFNIFRPAENEYNQFSSVIFAHSIIQEN